MPFCQLASCKKSSGDLKVCAQCKQVYYCSKDHQREDWPKHKPICLLAKESFEKGFVKQTITPGDGKTFPKKGDVVRVHYTGTFVNGVKFDSSVDRNQEFTFNIGLGQVIKGWDEGFKNLSVGEKAKLVISPKYGYGDRDYMDIPGGSVLIFEVELLGIGNK